MKGRGVRLRSYRMMSVCRPRVFEIYQISIQGESIHFHLCLPVPEDEQDKYKQFFNTGVGVS